MAVDILMKELVRIEKEGPAVPAAGGDDRMAAARQALMEDLTLTSQHDSEESNVLFGKGGIE
jgi:hypothetical protein